MVLATTSASQTALVGPTPPAAALQPTGLATAALAASAGGQAPATTAAQASTTSAPPPSTTTSTIPTGGPSLHVTTRDGSTSGPPGVGLVVVGEGFPCSQVAVKLDQHLLGRSATTAGRFRTEDLEMPGGAPPGNQTVTAECGGAAVAAAAFRVTGGAVHRPDLVTSLPEPDDVAFSLGELATSAGLALVAIPLIFFPFAVVEEVMDNHYDEIRGWFGRHGARSEKEGWAAIPAFLVFMAVAAAIYTALQPTAGFDTTTAVVFGGLLLGLCAAVLSEGVPAQLYAQRHRQRAPMRALPGSLVVAVVVVGLSRLLNFHPGYAFGAVAGFYLKDKLDRRNEGRLAAAAVLSLLAVSLLAWVAWAPVAHLAAEGNPGLGLVVLEAALASTFMVGLETSLVLALPIRFVHGGNVARWNRWAWAAMFAVVLFPVVHIMFRNGQHTLVADGVHPLVIIALTVAFALFTVCFWGYFRFRPERPRPPAGDQMQWQASGPKPLNPTVE